MDAHVAEGDPLRPFLFSFGLLAVVLWALMPGYVTDRHIVAAAGVILLAGWLVLSIAGDARGRRANAVRAEWERVAEEVGENLAGARRLLPASTGRGGLATFEEAILRGDLPAALAELETLGIAAGPPAEYWQNLASAAGRMGLDETRVRLQGRVSSSAPPTAGTST